MIILLQLQLAHDIDYDTTLLQFKHNIGDKENFCVLNENKILSIINYRFVLLQVNRFT